MNAVASDSVGPELSKNFHPSEEVFFEILFSKLCPIYSYLNWWTEA